MKLKNLLKSNYIRRGLIIIISIFLVYFIVYVDVILRAREAYLEGEKYLRWHNNPELKKQELEKKLKDNIKKLEEKFKKGKITKEEFDKEMEILKFEHEQQLNESSIKYAYIWYKTAVELFSPPRSKYVRLCEDKMKIAKEMWKQELTKKGIKYKDYMLE